MKRPNALTRLLSYLMPIQRPYASEVSDRIVVSTVNGHTSVQTHHANYSFDSLQRLLEIGLRKIPNLQKKSPALILGLGAGSVVFSLRHVFQYSHPVHGIELDPVMLEIAESHFNLGQLEHLTIEQTDAFDFVSSSDVKWGLVVVDLFIDHNIPGKFSSMDFLIALENILTANGCILFNLGFREDEFAAMQRHKILTHFENLPTFKTIHLTQLEGTSELMIATRIS